MGFDHSMYFQYGIPLENGTYECKKVAFTSRNVPTVQYVALALQLTPLEVWKERVYDVNAEIREILDDVGLAVPEEDCDIDDFVQNDLSEEALGNLVSVFCETYGMMPADPEDGGRPHPDFDRLMRERITFDEEEEIRQIQAARERVRLREEEERRQEILAEEKRRKKLERQRIKAEKQAQLEFEYWHEHRRGTDLHDYRIAKSQAGYYSSYQEREIQERTRRMQEHVLTADEKEIRVEFAQRQKKGDKETREYMKQQRELEERHQTAQRLAREEYEKEQAKYRAREAQARRNELARREKERLAKLERAESERKQALQRRYKIYRDKAKFLSDGGIIPQGMEHLFFNKFPPKVHETLQEKKDFQRELREDWNSDIIYYCEKQQEQKVELKRMKTVQFDKVLQKILKKKDDAGALFKAGQYAEAISAYKAGATLLADNLEEFSSFKKEIAQHESTFFNNIALCYSRDGDAKRVIEYTTKVLDRLQYQTDKSVVTKALVRRGASYRDEEKHKKAADDFARAKDLDPYHKQAADGLRDALKTIKQWEGEDYLPVVDDTPLPEFTEEQKSPVKETPAPALGPLRPEDAPIEPPAPASPKRDGSINLLGGMGGPLGADGSVQNMTKRFQVDATADEFKKEFLKAGGEVSPEMDEFFDENFAPGPSPKEREEDKLHDAQEQVIEKEGKIRIKWTQKGDDVNVDIPIPDGTTSKQLQVTILAKSLVVKLNKDTLFEGEFFEKIKHHDSQWAVEEKRILNLTLEKVEEGVWSSAFVGDSKVNVIYNTIEQHHKEEAKKDHTGANKKTVQIEDSGFEWRQARGNVEVKVPMPAWIFGQKLTVALTATAITVNFKAAGPTDEPLMEGKFWANIKPGDSQWDIDADEKVLNLDLKKMLLKPWKSFLLGGGEVSTAGMETRWDSMDVAKAKVKKEMLAKKDEDDKERERKSQQAREKTKQEWNEARQKSAAGGAAPQTHEDKREENKAREEVDKRHASWGKDEEDEGEGRIEWFQDKLDVEVRIPLPKGTKSKQLSVKYTKTTIKVTFRDQPEEPALLDGEFLHPINPDCLAWSVEKNKFALHLEKVVDVWWISVMKVDATVPMVEEPQIYEVKDEPKKENALSHQWRQTRDEVEINIPLPEGLRGKDLKVDLKAKTLCITRKDAKPSDKPLLQGEFFGTVKTEKTEWTIDDDTKMINIILAKVKVAPWKGALVGGPEVDIAPLEKEYAEAEEARLKLNEMCKDKYEEEEYSWEEKQNKRSGQPLGPQKDEQKTTWEQTKQSMDVKIPIPEGTTEDQLLVDLKAGSIKIALKKKRCTHAAQSASCSSCALEASTMLEGEFFERIKPEASDWAFAQEGVVVLKLKKTSIRYWPTFVKDEDYQLYLADQEKEKEAAKTKIEQDAKIQNALRSAGILPTLDAKPQAKPEVQQKPSEEKEGKEKVKKSQAAKVSDDPATDDSWQQAALNKIKAENETALTAKGWGNKHYRQKNYTEAIKCYDQAAEKCTDDSIFVVSLSNAAQCYLNLMDAVDEESKTASDDKQEHARMAAAHCEAALEKDPKHRKTIFRQAKALCHLKYFVESMKMLRSLGTADADVNEELKRVEKARDYSMGIIR